MFEENNKVQFIDKDIENDFFSLKKSDPKLFKQISRAIQDLKCDKLSGRPAPKWFLKKKFGKMGYDNIWRYNLPGAWRLLYSIKGGRIDILIIILDWMPHKKYEKMIGLKK